MKQIESRHARSKNSADGVWYPLNVETNQTDPETMEARLLPMSANEWDRLEERTGKVTGRGVNFAKRQIEMNQIIFENRIPELRVESDAGVEMGWSFVDPATGETLSPRNGKELWNVLGRLDPSIKSTIVEDLIEAIKDHSRIDAAMEKKQRSRFGLRAATIEQPGNGHAVGAPIVPPPS